MSVGHPDWQTYAGWRGAPLVSGFPATVAAGGSAYGPFAIQNWAALTLRGVAQGQDLVYQLVFSADAAGANTVQTMEWGVTNGASVSVNVPALGPYVTLNILNIHAVSTSAVVFLLPTNIAAQSPQYICNATPAPLMWASASVAASGNLSITAAEVYAGPVSVFVFSSSGTSYSGQLEYFDTGALAYRNIAIFQGTNLAPGDSVASALPSSIGRLVITNNDSVSRQLTGAVLRAA